jgi:beta-N-acetylglucosaminidase
MSRAHLLLLAIIFSGCVSNQQNMHLDVQANVKNHKPKIHLHIFGELKTQTDKLATSLRQSGYEVMIRDNELPMNDEQSFIIYNLSPLQNFELEKIKSVLSNNGIDITTIYSFQNGKHMYSLGNVGIYLISDSSSVSL